MRLAISVTPEQQLRNASGGNLLIAAADLRYDLRIGDSVTVVSGKVSALANLGAAGSAWNLSQSTAGNRLTYSATAGKYGDPAMVGDPAGPTFMQVSASRAQPMTLIVRAKNTGDTTAYRVLADGSGANLRLIRVEVTTGHPILYGGAVLDVGVVWTNGVWKEIAGVFNGASSVIDLSGTIVSGDAGAGASTGLTLGANGAGTLAWSGPIDLCYGWFRVLSTTELAAVLATIG